MCLECTYLFLRPRSLPSGDLSYIYGPVYGIYAKVDKSYSAEAYERGDGFPNAQSVLNAAETVISIYYIYLRHVAGSASAPLFGFMCAVMTFSKTVLFLSQEYYCDWCTTGHNDPGKTFWLWFIPALPWLVLPGMTAFTLGKDIITALNSGGNAKKKN